MIFIAFILLIAAVLICHARDWKENKKTGRVNHSKALKWKILLSAPAGILFVIYLTKWPVRWDWFLAMACLKSVILTGAWFMFLFNGIWGYRAAKSWFYRSSAVGKNLSRYDRIVLHWPKVLYISFVLALIVGATLIYFL